MDNHNEVIVIGGGINGVSTAFHLAIHGTSVTLLEKRFIAGGPTGLSSAIVRQHYSNPVTIRMALNSLRVWQSFSDVVGGEAEFTQTGVIFGVTPGDIEGLKANIDLQQAEGIDTRFVAIENIPEIEPHGDPTGLGGAAYEPEGGYCDPSTAANAFAKAAQRLGAKIHTGVTATGFKIESGKIVGVETNQGFFPAEAVVVACGPWTPILLKKIGIDLPIIAARIKIGLYRRPEDLDRHRIWCDFANQVYLRPETGNLMLVGSISPDEAEDQIDDPDNFNEHVEFDILAEFAERAAKRFPAMTRSHLANNYAALYDITPDWHPILDGVPDIDGLYICAGSSGHGFKLAPAVGEMMARLVLRGKEPEDDINLFSMERFASGNLVRGQYEYSIIG